MRFNHKGIIIFLTFLFLNALNAQDLDHGRVRQIITGNASLIGITASDAQNSRITSAYADEKTGLQYVYLQQAEKDIKVFNIVKTIVFRNNGFVYSAGDFINELSQKIPAEFPALDAAQAVRIAAQHLFLPQPSGLLIISDEFETSKKISFNAAGIAKQEIVTELYWVVTEEGSIRLAWNVNIDVKGSSDWWNVRVDAHTGEVLEKDNWTVNERGHEDHAHKGIPAFHTSAANASHKEERYRFIPPPPSVTQGGYFVVPFPGESPKHRPLAMQLNPWMKAGANNPATSHGWHFDGNNNYQITRGNNVFAYLDLGQPANTPNGINFPDTSSTAIPALSFSAAPDFTKQPSTRDNRKSAVTNLFYWNNIIHDLTYQYGFTEAAGNFQADNLGRGGIGNDYVQAEAQDASGIDNANFSTPSDGSRPRMQMFLWEGPSFLTVTTPSGIAGNYVSVESNFSTANQLSNLGPVTGQVVYYNDNAAGTAHLACVPPANILTGKIALIQRGDCNFTDKVKAAQMAGAIGVIMINNVGGAPIIMGGTDNTVTIPAVMISQNDGAVIAAQLNNNVTATLSAGINIDGDFDNGVVVHEYGHGISNRFTGGPANASCLNNAEQAGEGWSDYLGLMMTTDWQNMPLNGGATPRGIGSYASGQNINGGGIRAYPYSTSMSVNPLTYNNLLSSQQVHFIGTVWCTALWDMTWNIIQQAGFIEPDIFNSSSNGGNVIALRLVMEGMRLQPCRPGFLDARNAILAADSILYNGAYKCAIWNAFAKRGMGFSAQQGLSTVANDQTAAFDVPASVKLQKSTLPVTITNGEQHTINLSVSCECQLPQGSYSLKETLPPGFSYVSSTGGSLNGSSIEFPSFNFTALQETKNFSITIQAGISGCSVDTVLKDSREGTSIGLLSPSSGWTSSVSRSKSAPNSWFVPNVSTATDASLVSGPFTVNELSVLSFWHYYVTENTIDGGRVEISTDNGSTWNNAQQHIILNGYNAQMNAASPWGFGERAFSGVSYGQGSGQFVHSMIDLSSFSGQNIRVRFRMRTNSGNSGTYEGWFIDDIYILNGCGSILGSTLSSNNQTIGTGKQPLFVKPGANAPQILSQPVSVNVCASANTGFSVSASGPGTLSYQWEVSENNGSYIPLAGETAASLQLNNVNSSMNGNRYRVIINNGVATITSAGALLTVQASTLAADVVATTVCAGSTAVFNVVASGGGLVYQWQVSTNGGTSFSDLAGATTASLTITNASLVQNGNLYRVMVNGNCGNVVTNAAALTVREIPVVTIGEIPSNLCSGDPSFQLTASVSGGTWSGMGVTGDRFNPSTAGSFPVSYSASNSFGCSGMASATVVVVNCVERNVSLNAPGSVILFPNPNDGNFSLKFNTERYPALGLRVYASDGKLVHVQQLSGIAFGTIRPFNLAKLASGIYQLSLFDEKSGEEKLFRLLIIR